MGSNKNSFDKSKDNSFNAALGSLNIGDPKKDKNQEKEKNLSLKNMFKL